jgi:hypothetical protein
MEKEKNDLTQTVLRTRLCPGKLDADIRRQKIFSFTEKLGHLTKKSMVRFYFVREDGTAFLKDHG